jgi:CubicO group peptidase (beta-lactamase class C family)
MKTALALTTLLGLCVALPALARPDVAAADTAVRAYIAREGIPAAHVTIIRGDEVILQRGFGSTGTDGPAPDAASIFPLGSISKQFTAATILALVDAGKVRLDVSVGQYLPEWFADEPALRVSHLLSQTSGLADFLWLEGYRPLADNPATPIAAYVALGSDAPRRFAPGARWSYSNTNYKALALIVERVTGRPFDSVLADLVLRPAGLDGIMPCHSLRPDQFVPGVSAAGRSTPLDASAAAYVGDGGLCGNAATLVKWIRFGLKPSKERISRLALSSRLADGTQVPYGFGLSSREFLGHSMIWHGGNVDSHSSMIAYLPAEDLGLVILTSKGFVWLTELMPALLGDAPPARANASGPR